MNPKRSFLKPAWSEALLLGLCAAACCAQLFVRPYIGLANNGDFGKVFARFGMDPPDGGARNFVYFVSDYDFVPHVWKSSFRSSETVLAAVSILPAKASGARSFNIRWLGTLHLLLFLAAAYALLVYLRPFGRAFQIPVASFALFIFTDVAYVSYFNSFFSDTPALLGLLAMVPLALYLAGRQSTSGAALWVFTAAAVLFVTSKSQHTLMAIFPVALLLSLRAIPWRRRLAPAALVAASAVYMVVTQDEFYTSHALFNMIFYKIAPGSRVPEAAVRELGLGPDEYRFIGTHAFTPGNPTVDIPWLRYFNGRTSFGKVLRYWWRHPHEAMRALRNDRDQHACDLRQRNLANFRREDGYPPGTLATRFAFWSNLRSEMYRLWPAHIFWWYAAVIGVAAANLRRHRAAASICLGVCAFAILEFCFACLTDAVETERHLFIFHAATEITICFAAAWALAAIAREWRRSSLEQPGETSIRRERHHLEFDQAGSDQG